MENRLLDNGPVVLVPSAWTVVGAAHMGLVSERTLLIAHTVMALLLAVFAVTAWSEMDEGVLCVWRSVLVVGFFLTVAGIFGLLGFAYSSILLRVSLYGWILAPAAGLAYTGMEVVESTGYSFGALLSVGGGVMYTVALVQSPAIGVSQGLIVASIAIVGIGQTIGIADAVYRY